MPLELAIDEQIARDIRISAVRGQGGRILATSAELWEVDVNGMRGGVDADQSTVVEHRVDTRSIACRLKRLGIGGKCDRRGRPMRVQIDHPNQFLVRVEQEHRAVTRRYRIPARTNRYREPEGDLHGGRIDPPDFSVWQPTRHDECAVICRKEEPSNDTA